MKKKILVVDDEREIVNFLENFLSRLNLVTIKATAAKEAMACYLKHKPDGIFLDIAMPDKDGLTLLKELKEIDPDVKVIMITAKDDKKTQDKAKRYGALDYITKPLDLHELAKKIEQYILKVF
jgi:DNA-binding NtrC family response regulator